jgi:hypothetical protein
VRSPEIAIRIRAFRSANVRPRREARRLGRTCRRSPPGPLEAAFGIGRPSDRPGRAGCWQAAPAPCGGFCRLFVEPAVGSHARTGRSFIIRLARHRRSDGLAPAVEMGSKVGARRVMPPTPALRRLGRVREAESARSVRSPGVDLLIRNPDALRDLRDHPDLIETAVEEFLRMESSNQLGNQLPGVLLALP